MTGALLRICVSYLMYFSRRASRAARVVAALALAGCSSAGDGVAAPDAAFTGSVSLDIAGIPAGASASIRLTRGDKAFTAPASGLIAGVPVGLWTLIADPIVVGGLEYRAEPASQSVTVGRSVGTAVHVSYVLVTGSLTITLTGLAPGVSGAITVTGPGQFNRTVVASETIFSLIPGRYRVFAARVQSPAGGFDPARPLQDIDVAGGSTPAAALVSYGAAPASIGVDVLGLPPGVDADITLTAPSGGSSAVVKGVRFENGEAGRWRLAAAVVRSAGFSYAPTPSTADSTVLAGDSLRFAVRYSLATGALAVAVTGLPAGTDASIAIGGPNGFARTVSGTTTITDLEPGEYTLLASTAIASGITYRAASATRQVMVDASLVAAPALFAYAPVTASLVVSVSGAPGGATDFVRIVGPNTFDRTLAVTTVLDGLVPGVYTVTASDIVQPVATWRASAASVQRTLAGDARDSVAVQYAVITGSVAIAVTGLPTDVDGSMRLSGPNGYTLLVGKTITITGLVPGAYTLVASDITYNGFTYSPTPVTQQLNVAASLMAAPANVSYGIQNASLVIAITGAPPGLAQVQISGPSGYTRGATNSTTLTALLAGTYTVSAYAFTSGTTTYTPAPPSSQRTLAANGRDSVAIVYTGSAASATGSIAVTVNGLPTGTNASIVLSGNSTSRSVTGTSSITGLTPGTYTFTASNVTSGASTYVVAPATSSVPVTAGNTTAATFTYTLQATPPPPTSDDLSVEFAYVTQATQRPDGSVPLVTGRNALLRVFVKNNRSNTLTPDVRARIYDGATLLQTVTIAAPESGVRTALDEGTLSSTWNTTISAANVRVALRVLVDVDPGATITDADRTNNTWPRGGVPASVSVSDVPVFTVRFVPVTVGALTGNVTVTNMAQFLLRTKLVHPLNVVIPEVRLPFVSSAADLQSNDANGAWLTVLSELNALRSMDNAPSTLHYYGVVKVSYTSGIAGYGYVPGRTAMGWDYLPSGDGVAAHEFGHNFSRPHSPCGVAGDAAYPYSGGTIGYYGWNSTSNALIRPTATDFMGYCTNTWTSDWTWSRVMTYRGTSGFSGTSVVAGKISTNASVYAAASGDGLLVWGRIANGRVLLEPAFRLTAPISPRVASSVFHLEALDADGRALLDIPVDASVVDHVTTHDERQFAVVVPWSPTLELSLASLRVRDVRTPLSSGMRSSETARRVRRTPSVRIESALAEPATRLERTSRGDRLRWNSSAYPMAIVRDVATGQMLAFLRRSGDGFVSGGRAVDVIYSDGVRSVTRRVRAGQEQ